MQKKEVKLPLDKFHLLFGCPCQARTDDTRINRNPFFAKIKRGRPYLSALPRFFLCDFYHFFTTVPLCNSRFRRLFYYNFKPKYSINFIDSFCFSLEISSLVFNSFLMRLLSPLNNTSKQRRTTIKGYNHLCFFKTS